MGIYSFYEKRLFPRVLDLMMKQMAPLRDDTLAAAQGEVLEIGFGTGLNLRHYPPAVKRLHALDPMDALHERVAERIAAVDFPVERHALPADGGLPFEDHRFDTVTVTWTLCTIPDARAALREMRRVLKPDGKLLFIEHGLSDQPNTARWQERLNPMQNVIGCGCNLNRKMDTLIESGGFAIEHLDFFVAEDTPAVFGTLYRGTARP